MAKRIRIQPGEARAIRGLTNSLDEYTARTLLTPEGKRLIRPERFANLQSGKAQLTEAERERLQLLSANRQALTSLKRKQRGKEVLSKRGKEVSKRTKEQRENRALRTWVFHGKEKETPYDVQADSVKQDQQPAIHALFYLGVDPISDKTYYTKGIPAK
jgi:hypothetical protein